MLEGGERGDEEEGTEKKWGERRLSQMIEESIGSVGT